jgi:hypothetical protein
MPTENVNIAEKESMVQLPNWLKQIAGTLFSSITRAPINLQEDKEEEVIVNNHDPTVKFLNELYSMRRSIWGLALLINNTDLILSEAYKLNISNLVLDYSETGKGTASLVIQRKNKIDQYNSVLVPINDQAQKGFTSWTMGRKKPRASIIQKCFKLAAQRAGVEVQGGKVQSKSTIKSKNTFTSSLDRPANDHFFIPLTVNTYTSQFLCQLCYWEKEAHFDKNGMPLFQPSPALLANPIIGA